MSAAPRNWQRVLAALDAVECTVPAQHDAEGRRIREAQAVSLAGHVDPVIYRYGKQTDRLRRPFAVFRMVGTEQSGEPPLRGPGRREETFEIVIFAPGYEALDCLWRAAARAVSALPGASTPGGGTDSTLEDAPTTVFSRTMLVTIRA